MSVRQLDVAIDRPLPQSPGAERAVLGSILINNAAFYRVDLTTDDFFNDAHRSIWSAMCLLAEERREIDLLTLKEELASRGILQDCGGSAYIASLVDGIPDVANVEQYAVIVKDKAKLRRLIVAGNRMMSAALDSDADPTEIASEAMRHLSPQTSGGAECRELVEIISENFHKLAKQANGEIPGAIRCGLPDLDLSKCFCRKKLTGLGFPSNHGKTSLAVALSDGFTENGHSVVFFSLESSEDDVALRWASARAQVAHSRTQDWSRLLDRQDDLKRLHEAAKAASAKRLRIERKIRTVEGIYAACRRLKQQHGLDVALIDYIQLVRTEERIGNLEERYAHISQLLLEYSIDLDISIIITSQLNKDWRSRPITRPLADGRKGELETVAYELDQEDLKRCAAIGETCRVLLLGYRPALVGLQHNIHGDEIGRCYVDLKIAKNNENVTGRYDAHFDEVCQTFKMGLCRDNKCQTRGNGDKPKPEQGVLLK